MEALIFIALVIVIILLFNIRSSQKETASRTHQSFLSLKKELIEIRESSRIDAPTPVQPATPSDETVVQWRPTAPAPVKPVHPIPPAAEQAPTPTPTPAGINFPIEQQAALPVNSPSLKQEGWKQQWLRNNPDLEKFIGENLVNKIGIAILVLGIAFFVKYAIDQDWIKEAGRVSIGVACGLILVGLAHFLRNTYRSFSSVLAGGGIAVFYFTIAFGFHQYQLFSQTAAFVVMVVITIFAVLLSLLYNKSELAVIAAIGGYLTPFLVSTGSGNFMILFTYLLILNVGMVALAFFKKWPLIHVIALLFTLLIYGGWLMQQTIFSPGFLHYKSSFAFATAFYLLFVLMSVIYNIRTTRPFKSFDFSLLMVITFSYYAAGMANLHFWKDGNWQGIFTITLGAWNFCLAYYFYRTRQGDRNLLYLLIGLTLTFISLAVPVQLHGHTITLFWSAEFVLLYWLHRRSGISVFKYSSLVIMMAMAISLAMDWQNANVDGGGQLPVMYTGLQGLVTNTVAALAFFLYAIQLRKQEPGDPFFLGLNNQRSSTIMFAISVMLIYLTAIFGVNLYFYTNQSLHVPNAWHQLITYKVACVLLWSILKYRPGVNAAYPSVLTASCIGMYLFSAPAMAGLRDGVLTGAYSTIQWMVHWISAAVLLYLVYQLISFYRRAINSPLPVSKTFIWLISSSMLAFFSIEAMHNYVYFTSAYQDVSTALQQYSKAGITIVWGLCSFAIMWLGMKHKFKTLRIVSLVIFLIALVKLFLFDIRNISEGGKIAAFIMLGILLLIISFMYQKLRKIIIDDNTG